ncbi:MAG: aldo/keto reductase [Sphingomonas sp.]
MLPARRLGPFEVSALGLGCMNLSHGYGSQPSEADSVRLLNTALDLGVTLFDTAALYGFGANERLIGKALGHRRGEFRLASKCVLGEIDGKRGLDGSPQAIASALEGSLQRLGTDHIDLYYLHRLDRKVPIEDSVGALVRAKEAGKIGALGLSEMSAATLRRAHAVHPIAAMQSEYSPAVRNPEVAVLEACRELGTAFVAFSPVARGLLAGSVRNDRYMKGDIRGTIPRFLGAHLQRNLGLVAKFEALAAAHDITPAQLALAWLLSRGDHVIPIPGTRSLAHLGENLAAATLDIPTGTLARIDILFPANALSGARYPAAAQAQVDTETLPGEPLDPVPA